MNELDIIRDFAFNKHIDDYYGNRCTFRCWDNGYSIVYLYGVLDVYFCEQFSNIIKENNYCNIVLHLN